ncbi:unnamed protein product [Chilo suppressalis]|uniref:Uncharacterized protein n=1 Tax=Chilo suppressalis TaxID=168631 RepID=A0ABN8L829_CHISP|nr:unnamed protein product [Chilo suppressalis]
MRTIIAIAIMNLAEAFLSCADVCKSQGQTAGHLACFCSHENTVRRNTFNKRHTGEALIVDDSPIFYEPLELSPYSVSFLERPFYLLNPTSSLSQNQKNLKFKKLKRSNNPNQFDFANSNPIRKSKGMPQTLISSTEIVPLYLDIDVNTNDMQRSSDLITKDIENVEELENNLMDCINLHILIDLEKDDKYIINSKYIKKDQVKKYLGLSDSELMVEIRNKCAQPNQIIETNLKDIKKILTKKSLGERRYKEKETNANNENGSHIREHPMVPSTRSENVKSSPNSFNNEEKKGLYDAIIDQYNQNGIIPVPDDQLVKLLLNKTDQPLKTTEYGEEDNNVITTSSISPVEEIHNLSHTNSSHFSGNIILDYNNTQINITNELSTSSANGNSDFFIPQDTKEKVLDFSNELHNKTFLMLKESSNETIFQNTNQHLDPDSKIPNLNKMSSIQPIGELTSSNDSPYSTSTENYFDLGTKQNIDADSDSNVQNLVADLGYVESQKKSPNLNNGKSEIKVKTSKNNFQNLESTQSSSTPKVILDSNTLRDSVQNDTRSMGLEKLFANDQVTSSTDEYITRTKTDNFVTKLLIKPNNATQEKQENTENLSTTLPIITRLILEENDINITRVSSREFKNDSLISEIQGTETLPNNDFVGISKEILESTTDQNIFKINNQDVELANYNLMDNNEPERTTFPSEFDLNNQGILELPNNKFNDKNKEELKRTTDPVDYSDENKEILGNTTDRTILEINSSYGIALENNDTIGNNTKSPEIITVRINSGSNKQDVIGLENNDPLSGKTGTPENAPRRSDFSSKNGDIVGNLYLLFHEHSIPAKFVQNQDGEIKFGIDGKTLCDKIENKGLNDSLIISALCKCSKTDKCMENVFTEIS